MVVAVAVVAAVAGGAPAVETFGTIRELVRAGDAAPKVVLADVLRAPHAHGLGSLSGLRGEITILDGVAWLSYPPERAGDRPRVVVSRDTRERAGFLVAAHVDASRWQKVVVGEPLSSVGLEAMLRPRIAQAGLGGTDVPFRIDGRFASLTLAVIDGDRLPPGARTPDAIKQANVLDRHAGVDATLVGFFAAAADERFTHPGSRIHVHAVVPSPRATGHAQAFTAAPGAVLWLPAGL
jgi:acetolactate decarboxylase